MKIKQAKEYYELGVLTSFDIIKDALNPGCWLLVIGGEEDRSWTAHTSLGQVKSYARLETVITDIETISGAVPNLHIRL